MKYHRTRPNLIPAVLGFGVWGLINGEINLSLSLVTSLTLGIIVDDTAALVAALTDKDLI